MKMIQINYKEKKLLTEEEMIQEELDYMIGEQKLSFERDLLANRKDLSTLKAQLKSEEQNYPLDIVKIYSLYKQISELEKAIEYWDKDLRNKLGF